MNKNDIAAKARNCARHGCLQIGRWLPVLTINMIGAGEFEKPVTIGIPMFLCDVHKKEFEPQKYLSTVAKMKLMVQVAARYRRKLNWDTLNVQWRTEGDASRVIATDDIKGIH